MTKDHFFNLLDDLLAVPKGTLKGPEKLTELRKWDSLAILEFIAILDEHLGVTVPAEKIIACRTTADLVALAGDKVAA
jgi:acyl carrier protein